MGRFAKGAAIVGCGIGGALAGAGGGSLLHEYMPGLHPEPSVISADALGDNEACQRALTGLVYVEQEVPDPCRDVQYIFPTCKDLLNRGPGEEQEIADLAPAVSACVQAQNLRGDEALDDHAYSQAIFSSRVLYRLVNQEQESQDARFYGMIVGGLVGLAIGIDLVKRRASRTTEEYHYQAW